MEQPQPGTQSPDMGSLSAFNSQQSQQQQSAPQEQQSSTARQLLSEMAPLNASLKKLAEQYPQMSKSVDSALQVLLKGFNEAVSQMQSPRDGEGNNPAYA